ncbi:MAG: hypothetical protein E5V42_02025 [Mesorhizobium sp.]|nr:MAG: hypothetical protein E5V42_02025 [Mesorhizobium sp.]
MRQIGFGDWNPALLRQICFGTSAHRFGYADVVLITYLMYELDGLGIDNLDACWFHGYGLKGFG